MSAESKVWGLRSKVGNRKDFWGYAAAPVMGAVNGWCIMGAGKFRVESYELREMVRRLKYNGRREFLYAASSCMMEEALSFQLSAEDMPITVVKTTEYADAAPLSQLC